MCGIAALFGTQIDRETLQTLVSMTNLVKHRGPDGEGFEYFGTQAALGHRRLAIVGLTSAGRQPFQSADGRYWITYNGEIYNYKELRAELGGDFRSETDTEVLLAAYIKWGKEALHRFNGMFAFAIYDTQEQTLFAARDRFGVKPLYYWETPSGVLAIASEIKQFTCLPGWKAQLNGQRAHDFLNWGVKDHTRETFFNGVAQLRGGEYLFVRLGEKVRPQTWYQLPLNPFQGTFQESAERFSSLLNEGIQLRFRADVPVGSCLSGGLDSSSIVCLSKGLLQKAFIVQSELPQFDESHFAKIAVNSAHVSAQFTTPTLETLFNQLDALVWHQDEPFISTSQFAQWSVFQLVKEHGIKVVLNGQGSDEQLAGYSGFFGNRFFDLFSSLRWNTLIQEITLAKTEQPHLQPYALLGNKLTPDWLRQPLRKILGKTSEHSGWFNHQKLQANPRSPFWKEKAHTVNQQCRQQLLYSSLPMLLHFEDRNSMAHSVESRVPFLDYRLVEFLNGLPSDFKIGGGWSKRVLREAMKGILPEPIRIRKDKMGFVTAESHWICHVAPQQFRRKIQEAVESSQGIIDPKVFQIVDRVLARKAPFDLLLWRLISFGEWLNRFAVQLS